MKIIFLFFFLIILASCSNLDPNPEKSDEIYSDLLQELELATKGLEAEEKNLKKLEEERLKAIPQTGQIKFADKRVVEASATVNTLRQQKQFFEIKLELRKNDVKRRYLESKKTGKPWPDKQEIENYKVSLKLHRDKLNWDKNKGVKKTVPRGTNEHGAESEKKENTGGH